MLAAAASTGGGDGGGGGVSDAQQAQMQAQIDDYNLMLKQSFEEKERLAQEMEQVKKRVRAISRPERRVSQERGEPESRVKLIYACQPLDENRTVAEGSPRRFFARSVFVFMRHTPRPHCSH